MFEREKICARKREKCRVNLERKMRNFTTFTTINCCTLAKTLAHYSPGSKDNEEDKEEEEDDAIIIDDDDFSIS